ncbi:MAG: FtsX-like permease family protein [Dictyoglomus sp.]
MLGGFLGIFMGWFLNNLLNFALNKMLIKDSSNFVRIFYVPLSLVIATLLFALLLSAVAGLYPAIRASRLDPVEALRYE